MIELAQRETGLSRELVDALNNKLSTTGDHYNNITDALEILCHRIGASRGIIKLYSRYDTQFIQDIIWPGGESHEGENLVAQKVLDCGGKPYFHTENTGTDGVDHPLVGLPILNNDYPLGVAVFTGECQDDLRIFLDNDLEYYLPLLVVPAENMLLHRVLIDSYLRTIESLAIALEAKDNYTIGHSNLVMAYSLDLARELKLDKASMDAIEIGALMHDIGKIGVRDEILQKDDKLTEEEFKEMKRHPLIGEQILEPLKHDIMDLPRKIVRWHHEQINGAGYPDGISSDEIPLEVKIVSVADIFEALTSDRPYRKALDIADAMAILQNLIPHHLDAEIVAILSRLML